MPSRHSSKRTSPAPLGANCPVLQISCTDPDAGRLKRGAQFAGRRPIPGECRPVFLKIWMSSLACRKKILARPSRSCLQVVLAPDEPYAKPILGSVRILNREVQLSFLELIDGKLHRVHTRGFRFPHDVD